MMMRWWPAPVIGLLAFLYARAEVVSARSDWAAKAIRKAEIIQDLAEVNDAICRARVADAQASLSYYRKGIK